MENSKNWNKFVGNAIPSSLKIQPIIYKFIKKNYKIIDIGCGFGKTVFNLHKKGYFNVYGVDSNKSGIEFANLKSRQLKLNPIPIFKIANALNLPYQNSVFDCVITQAFWTTLVTKFTRDKVIKEIYRILKKNGVLYIADFGQTWHLPLYKKRYDGGIKKNYEEGTFESTDKKTGKLEYLAHHFTEKEFVNLIYGGGFKSIEYYGHKIVTTRGGNKINGHIIVAKKYEMEKIIKI